MGNGLKKIAALHGGLIVTQNGVTTTLAPNGNIKKQTKPVNTLGMTTLAAERALLANGETERVASLCERNCRGCKVISCPKEG